MNHLMQLNSVFATVIALLLLVSQLSTAMAMDYTQLRANDSSTYASNNPAITLNKIQSLPCPMMQQHGEHNSQNKSAVNHANMSSMPCHDNQSDMSEKECMSKLSCQLEHCATPCLLNQADFAFFAIAADNQRFAQPTSTPLSAVSLFLRPPRLA